MRWQVRTWCRESCAYHLASINVGRVGSTYPIAAQAERRFGQITQHARASKRKKATRPDTQPTRKSGTEDKQTSTVFRVCCRSRRPYRALPSFALSGSVAPASAFHLCVLISIVLYTSYVRNSSCESLHTEFNEHGDADL